MASDSLPPEAVLVDYAYSFAKGKILYAAIENRLLDVYAREAKALAPYQVAELAKTDPDSTTRLIRALSGLGALEEQAEGTHDLTPLGKLLVSDQETGNVSPQAGLILHANEPPCWNAWHQLSRTVKEGGSGWEKTPESKEYGGLFDYYKAHPFSQNAFDRAMTGVSAAEIPALLQYDGFQNMDMLMDVGGGHGHLLAAITSKYPHIKGINFDMPHVIKNAPEIPHVEHASGDVFKAETLPKAPNIIMKHILHDWNDDACKTILASCYEALPQSGGKLLVVDFVIPNHGVAPPEARRFMTIIDIMMMMVVTGRERTEQEWKELLRSKGFEIARIIPTSVGPAIIEATKV